MSTEAPEILLAHYLKTLKLPTFQREYQKLARLCATEGVDHVGYLFRLAEREMIERKRYEWPTGISVDICRVPRPVGFRTSALSAAA